MATKLTKAKGAIALFESAIFIFLFSFIVFWLPHALEVLAFAGAVSLLGMVRVRRPTIERLLVRSHRLRIFRYTCVAATAAALAVVIFFLIEVPKPPETGLEALWMFVCFLFAAGVFIGLVDFLALRTFITM